MSSSYGYLRYVGKSSLPTPVRTKELHPYSYDPFTLWHRGGNENANGTIYTDRLYQWDYVKHDELCKRHFGDTGQYWDRRSPTAVQEFLREWCEDKNLLLIEIMEYCNYSTGYPVWRLDYRSSKGT